MRSKLSGSLSVSFLSLTLVAGCAGSGADNGDGTTTPADLAVVKRDGSTPRRDLVMPVGMPDGNQGTDDASENPGDDGGATDDGGLVVNDDASPATGDLTTAPAADMTTAATGDMTGPAADLKGVMTDLKGSTADMGAPPADLMVAAGDLSTVPGDMARPADMVSTADMGVTSGTVFSGAVTLYGVTSDGFAVFLNQSTMNIDIISITPGAKPGKIVAAGMNPQVLVVGKVVFVWPSPDASNVGPLYVWTAASSVQKASSFSIAGLAAASTDGKIILYTRNSRSAGSLTDLAAARADLTVVKVLLMGLNIPADASTCAPLISIAGTYAVATHCALGSTAATVSDWNLSNGTQKDLITNAKDLVSTDKAGTQAVVISSTGALQVVPLGAGSPTTVAMGAGYGYQTKDGTAAVWRDANGALFRSPLVSPSPVKLVSTGVKGLIGSSPDDKFVVFYSNADPKTGLTDLFAASTVTPGTPLPLDSKPDGVIGGPFGDAFTSDSTHALPFIGVDPQALIGTLNSQVLSGGAPTTHGTNVWVVAAATTSKIVFNDNYDATASTADIKTVDTASGMPKLIKMGADPNFFLDGSKSRVVYTLSGGSAGIYVQLLP